MAVKWTSISPCSPSSFSPSSVCLEPAGDPESLERSMQQRASCLQSSNFRLRWIRAQWSHWIDCSHLFIVWLRQWKIWWGNQTCNFRMWPAEKCMCWAKFTLAVQYPAIIVCVVSHLSPVTLFKESKACWLRFHTLPLLPILLSVHLNWIPKPSRHLEQLT